ncbi:MAG: alginate lyase family protein, partial [Planctomycetota bacterium]|nr:alginate lyase family protein [Planctomycetota bacterium]
SDWMDRSAATVPGATDLAWNPYTVATRIGWWVRSYLTIGTRRWQEWSEFHDRFLQNLWQQAAYLEDHLEWDLRGNHLLRDALGLAWAGRFFQDSEADRWLEKAAELISDQIPEQILPDGGHFERSPMYHLKVMEDLLTAALLLRDESTITEIRHAWRRMADYAVWVRHPDGEIPLLNDSSFKGACDPATMLELGGQIGARLEEMSPLGGQHFAETGLMVWHGDPWSFFFDVGPIGADCQPGHAHADSHTIEVSFEGQRLIVDPGTHGYDDDERRRYDRSTEAHNTVSVAGKDSSEVWDIFRAGRRAVTDQVRADFTNRGALCTARHDGYRFISADLRHERRVSAFNSGELTISDRVTGSGRHDLRGGYLIAPGWSASAEDSGWMLRSGNRGVRVKVDLPESVRKTEEHRRYHPEFGRELTVVRLGWAGSPRLPAKIQFEMVKA